MINEQKSDQEFNLRKILEIFKNHFIEIVTWGIAGLIISIIISVFFISPKYSATIDLLVNQKGTGPQSELTTQQADLQAINTYKDVLQKPVILMPVLQILKKSDNYQSGIGKLQSSISIQNQTNSQVISVTVKDDNPYTAADIANTVGDVFKSKIKKMMKINNVTIVSRAVPQTTPVSPNKKLNILVGLFMGLMIGIFISFCREFFDTTVKNVEFLNDELGLINLGIIYHIKPSRKDYRIVKINQKENGQDNRRRV